MTGRGSRSIGADRAHTIADFHDRARWHQTAADGPFMQRLLCTMALPDGRVTLAGDTLTRTTTAGKATREIPDAERAAVLRETFGIPVTECDASM